MQKKLHFPLSGALLLALVGLLVACRPGGTPPATAPVVTPSRDIILPTTTHPVPSPSPSQPTNTPGEQEERAGPTPTFSPPVVFRPEPGPLLTPLPTPSTAGSPVGAITYLVRSPDGVVAIQRLLVGEDGEASTTPALVKSLGEAYEHFHFSPDGAWGMRIIDNRQLELLDLENGEQRLLQLPPLAETFLDWHPDGQHILVRTQEGLSLVNIQSGEEIQLVLVPRAEGLVSSAAISPDGQQVIFALDRLSSWSEIWAFAMDGSEERLLRKVEHIVEGLKWSPDGSQVAFRGDGLMVMGADGEDLRTVDRTGAGRWTWSPDGRTLAVVTDYGANPGTTGLDGTQPVETRIYLIDVETGWQRLLLPHFEPSTLDPSWSPDGSQIAFVGVRGDTTQLWIADADGGNLRTLTEGLQGVRFPVWLPSGP